MSNSNSVLKHRPSMIRYHDLEVKFYNVGQISNSKSKDGIFGYTDPFKNGTSGGVRYPATINKIIYSSDATPTTLSGTVQDLNYAKRNVVMLNKGHTYNSNSMPIITVGCGITVNIVTDSRSFNTYSTGNMSSACIFKGYVCSVSRQYGQNGIIYSFEARDVKNRLTYQTIKKVYNGNYKKGSMPILNEEKFSSNSDSQYVTGRLTVEQILKDIINYSKKTSSYSGGKYDFVGFKFSDFDFNNDKYLKNFIPPTLSFDNITIFEAIYKLINSAGPYRIVVKYGTTSDTIYFPRLDSKCEHCGKEVELYYAIGSNSHSKSGSCSGSFDAVNVISDTTVRKIYDVCTLMKSYTGPVEWYSGHFYIVKGNTLNQVKASAMTKEFRQDSFASVFSKPKNIKYNILSCRNWDGYNYYFNVKSLPLGESLSSNSASSSQFVIVGAPLYPAWDPSSGYGPFQRSYDGFLPKNDNTGSFKSVTNGTALTLNYGVTENDIRYVKHRNFVDTVGKDRLYNAAGLSYVAYVPYDVCYACSGTGAVANDNNTDLSSYSKWFGHTRNLDGTKVDDAPSFTAFDFGFSSPTYKSASGMERYCGNGYLVPTKHPVPWKNTCPICRGTGIEPWFKMGTIMQTLVDISPDQAKIGELTEKRIGTSNSKSSIRFDKTYSQISEDMSYKYQAIVHIESNTSFPAYAYAGESNSSSWIPHPLKDAKQVKYLNDTIEFSNSSPNTSAKIFPDGNDGSERANDKDSKYVHVLYYTQVQEAGGGYSLDIDRSMVIFNNAQFISCSYPMASPQEDTVKDVNNKITYKVVAYDDKNKCFKYNNKGSMNGIGQYAGAFWRPARAWLTCYFKRDRFETIFGEETELTRTTSTKGKGTISPGTNNDDDDEDTYSVTTRIEDNRYCAEIRKSSDKDDDNSEDVEEFALMPIAKSIFCDDFKWQVHPWDFGKYNVPGAKNEDSDMEFVVPSDYGNLWTSVYQSNLGAGYYFPCAKIMKHEPLRDIELRSAVQNGMSSENILKGDVCGKVIAWTHKDDRIKLFERACAELERRNNVQISGTVSVRGFIPNFTGGLGWVTLYDGSKACIVKMEMTLGNNFTVEMEVGTEELRVGQKKEKDMEYDRLISDAISGLNLKENNQLIQTVTNTQDVSDNVTVLGPMSIGGGVFNG